MIAPRLSSLSALLAAALATVVSAEASATNGSAAPSTTRQFSARLTPLQEVPAVSSVARGSFRMVVDTAAQRIDYELEYSGLEGTVTQAHIHTAQIGVNGGIMLWLCGTTNVLPGAPPPVPPAAPIGPAGTPVCPGTNSGSIKGTLTPEQIQAVLPQGIAGPAEFAEVVRALRNLVTYANVHSLKFPGGEVRGQIVPVFSWKSLRDGED